MSRVRPGVPPSRGGYASRGRRPGRPGQPLRGGQLARAVAGLAAAWLAGSCAACSLVPGLLRMSPVEVISFAPDRALVDPAAVTEVSVRFSAAMNRPVTEQAFSLEQASSAGQGRRACEGRFAWRGDDRVLVFTPLVPPAPGWEYTFTVSRAAEDVHGNSLEAPFHFRFRTGVDDERPRILSLLPADGSVVSSLRQEIVVEFSEPVDRASFYAGFSVFPAVPGSFVWSAGGQRVSLRPLADYTAGTQYTLTLRTGITDPSGNALDQELRSHFRVEAAPKPEVQRLSTVQGERVLDPVSAGVALNTTQGIEKDERFLVSFSREVPAAQRAAALAVEPRASLGVSWSDEPASCTVSFLEPLLWQQVYTLKVLDQEYAFLVNGAGSRPPEVEALTLCLDLAAPGPAEYIPLEYAANYGFGDEPRTNAAFDVHLSHAVGARIDLGSFLEALTVSITGGCLQLAWERVVVDPPAPSPQPPPGPGRSVVRLHCSLFDDPTAAGTFSLSLSTALRDSLDNHLRGEYTLLFNNNTPVADP